MTGRGHRCWVSAIAALLMSGPAFSQVFKLDSDLLASEGGTQKVATVKAGASAEVLERKGFWVRVKAAGQVGWVKVTSLQFGASAGGKVGIDTGRLSKGNIVASSAARGMSRGEFLDAEPDERQLAAMLEFAPATAEVDQFRTAGGLIARKITPLSAAPVAPAEPQSPQGNGGTPSGRAPKPKEKPSDDW